MQPSQQPTLMASVYEQTDRNMIPNLLAAYISVHAVTGQG